ncbi:MYND-type domain-containing protein [Mycena sanguinolenta]|uniref:MYND-type domain-containing protein n=1 Tax=Mycena sanguinolenta TaxID=230812 RepID=A0A8H7DHH0_9AGAR|nr:MYND-type domain-containing protein [Mycena sanguinolenta]
MARNAQHHAELVRKLSAAPSRYIQTARQQSAPGLAALLDLSSVWVDVPQTIELGAVDVFLSHLRSDKAPALTRTPRRWQSDADFAHLSLVGISAMNPLIDDPRYQAQSRAVLDGWQGIFKWCSYIYDARVDSDSAQNRRMFFDSIFVVAMIETPGCLELVTKLWALEDIPAGVDSIILGPASTEILGNLLKFADVLGKGDIHKRVIEAAGGDIDFIVQLALGRVKKATKTINPDLGSLALSWHIDFIAQLCHPYPHPLRRAFFDADVIAIVTGSFVALSRIIARNPTPGCISMMTSCFNFFVRYLEGDDYLSLVHAVKAGFLPAFLDCSPMFSQMAEEGVENALNIMVNVLPCYLVYRSFIEAVAPVMKKLNKTPHYQRLIAQPMTNTAWSSFVALLEKRQSPLKHIYKLHSEGSPVSCDYIKRRLIDVKHNFKKCAACEAVYYCSPECQKLAWKSSHRAVCKEMKDERTGHREKGRPKSDLAALHGLAQWTADVNFAAFHTIAEKDFPDTPHEDLMPCIDFLRVPEEFSVKVIKPGILVLNFHLPTPRLVNTVSN